MEEIQIGSVLAHEGRKRTLVKVREEMKMEELINLMLKEKVGSVDFLGKFGKGSKRLSGSPPPIHPSSSPSSSNSRWTGNALEHSSGDSEEEGRGKERKRKREREREREIEEKEKEEEEEERREKEEDEEERRKRKRLEQGEREEGRGEEKECGGFVSIFSVIDHLLMFTFKEGMGRSEEDLQESLLQRLKDPVYLCLKSARKRIPLWSFDLSDPITKVLPPFVQGIGSVCVKDGPQPVAPLHHPDLAAYLFHSNLPLLSLSLQQSGILKEGEKIMVMYEDIPAITGYSLMSIHKVRAIPVVDMNGKLIGTLGTNLLKQMKLNDLKKLALPVLSFLQEFHPEGLKKGKRRIGKERKVGEILEMLIKDDPDPVWITDSNGFPIHSVSFASFFSLFL